MVHQCKKLTPGRVTILNESFRYFMYAVNTAHFSGSEQPVSPLACLLCEYETLGPTFSCIYHQIKPERPSEELGRVQDAQM